MEILIGCDPEVFMMQDGRYVCAHNAIPGDKANPHKVDKGAVQVDGMALEFNIDPASTAEEFVENINTVMATLRSMVPGYELVATPVAEFGAEYMQQIAKEAPEALILGCEPDFNAWNGGKPNPKPDGERTFRTGAGHIHIGWTNGVDINDPDHLEACMMMVKQLDRSLALASILWDDDTQRRTMYGQLGCFRPKPYGVEYRVLSNAWVKDERIAAWVFNAAKKAVEALLNGERWYEQGYMDSVFNLFNQPEYQEKQIWKDWAMNESYKFFGSAPKVHIKQVNDNKPSKIYEKYYAGQQAAVKFFDDLAAM